MEKPEIPLSYLKNLLCRHCENFVTCGPTHVFPDTSILCGRCRVLSKNIYRNFPYEVLASSFMYPCKNWDRHCSAILSWNTSLEHEAKCTYDGHCSFFCSHPAAFCKGRRYITREDTRLIPVPDYLLQNLECVHCECYLSCGPIFIRSDGKNICHRCVSNNGEPPDCFRNSSYEILADIMLFPCIFKNRGCPARLSFGREISHHEVVCSYGQVFKSSSEAHKKERGIIKTHSGHVYGTITPNSPLFSPPSDSNQQINNNLMKSLMKKQERMIKRADQIGSNFERLNSFEDSYKNSYTTYSASSRSSTPTPIDQNADFKYSPNNAEEVSMNSGRKVSGNSSRTSYRQGGLSRQSDYEVNLSAKSSFSQKRSPYFENDDLDEGIYEHSEIVDRTPSFHGGLGGNVRVGDKHLIDELKIKQNMIKRAHSLKEGLKRNDSKNSHNNINSRKSEEHGG